MSTSPTPASMVAAIEQSLNQGSAGVTAVAVDGTRVTYDRAQALSEIEYWRKRQGIAAGRRPRVATVDLSGF